MRRGRNSGLWKRVQVLLVVRKQEPRGGGGIVALTAADAQAAWIPVPDDDPLGGVAPPSARPILLHSVASFVNRPLPIGDSDSRDTWPEAQADRSQVAEPRRCCSPRAGLGGSASRDLLRHAQQPPVELEPGRSRPAPARRTGGGSVSIGVYAAPSGTTSRGTRPACGEFRQFWERTLLPTRAGSVGWVQITDTAACGRLLHLHHLPLPTQGSHCRDRQDGTRSDRIRTIET
jgi:hypothetical protein